MRKECVPSELISKFSMVLPNGAFRSVVAMQAGGEGSPALKIIDAWLRKLQRCDSKYISKSKQNNVFLR